MGAPNPWRRLSPLPLVRRIRDRLGPRRVTFLRQFGKLSVVGFVVFAVLGAAGVEMSSQPVFCKTCHYMKPYYDAWKTSSHKNVACIECHFPPDVSGQVAKKFNALVQVTKYITRQYGTRPWTEIEDASCLRSGCHSRRLLAGRVEIKGSPGVVFDHQPHFASFRRVTRLRCTSCHSQIVQGQHMTVTLSTCFTCHFKNRNAAERATQCALCHKPEALAKAKDLPFDHSMVLKREVNCNECHANAVRGTGFVPQERCWSCHSEPERIARYGDTEFMHAQHVTTHKIECQLCHEAIEHGKPEPVEQQAGAELVCSNCHEDAHKETVQLYSGTGMTGVDSIPDAMFAARVTCEACHRSHCEVDGKPIADLPSSAGCLQCHGEDYGGVLSRWKEIAGREVVLTSDGHSAAVMELAASPVGADLQEPAGKLLDEALLAIRFVKHGGGVHNVRYAHRALQQARDQINQAMGVIGSQYRMPALPDFEYREKNIVAEPSCRKCHSTAPTQPIEKYGTRFDHARHTTESHIDCSRCHEIVKMGEPGHGKMKLAPADCSVCHRSGPMKSPHESGWRTSHGHSASPADQKCQVCHGADACRTCHGVQIPHPSTWKKGHGQAARHRPDACSLCHTENSCRNCHGLQMPHPSDWKTEHGTWASARSESCMRCHQATYCASCHTVTKPQSHLAADWRTRTGHGNAAKSSSAACSTCHKSPSFCKDCHGGISLPHGSGWLADHPAQAVATPASCQICHKVDWCNKCHGGNAPKSHQAADFRTTHGKTPEPEQASCKACHGVSDACTRCHGGLAMPHPDNWAMADQHGAQAFANPGACARCHPFGSSSRSCRSCHEGLPPSWHAAEGFNKSHAERKADAAACELCHPTPACSACHGGYAMPHPDDWATTHGTQPGAKLSDDSTCMKCHKRDQCLTCHDEKDWH